MSVIVRLNGGLGNQLFQYAAAEYLASLDNTDLLLDLSGLEVLRKRKISAVRDLEISAFRTTFKLASKSEISRRRLKFRVAMLEGTSQLGTLTAMALGAIDRRLDSPYLLAREGSGWTIEQIESRHKTEHLYLSGYWSASIRHLEARRSTLLKQLVPRNEPVLRLRELGAEISMCDSTVVHVRRGDYISDPRVSGRNVTQPKYFSKGARRLQDDTQQFFVFSDDVEWCRENLDLGPRTRFVKQKIGETAADHLYLMSLARNFVIPNSTFSWWAAWLSQRDGKRVIRPALSVAPGVAHFEHLYPLSWESLDLQGNGDE